MTKHMERHDKKGGLALPKEARKTKSEILEEKINEMSMDTELSVQGKKKKKKLIDFFYNRSLGG